MAKKKKSRPKIVIDYATAMKAINKYRPEIISLPGVTGVTVGLRYKDGEPTDEIALRIHVKSAKDKNKLKKNALKKNADKNCLQEEYGGIKTDIIVSKCRTATYADSTGISIRRKNVRNRLGTIGTVVRARIDSKRMNVYTTAAHVASAKPLPKSAVVEVFTMGASPTRIGTVRHDHYFRNKLVDFAYIIPDTPPRKPTGRELLLINSTDFNRIVKIKIMRGTRTVTRTGKITSVDFDGVVDGKEVIEDHIELFVGAQDLSQGDSGAVVVIGKHIVGFLRGLDLSDLSKRKAYISKAKEAQIHTKNLKPSREFRL